MNNLEKESEAFAQELLLWEDFKTWHEPTLKARIAEFYRLFTLENHPEIKEQIVEGGHPEGKWSPMP